MTIVEFENRARPMFKDFYGGPAMKLSALLKELEGAREMARERSGDRELDPEVFICAVRLPTTTRPLDDFDVLVCNKQRIVISDL